MHANYPIAKGCSRTLCDVLRLENSRAVWFNARPRSRHEPAIGSGFTAIRSRWRRTGRDRAEELKAKNTRKPPANLAAFLCRRNRDRQGRRECRKCRSNLRPQGDRALWEKSNMPPHTDDLRIRSFAPLSTP